MKKQFFAACFVLLSAACASEQTTESTAIILDEHNMTDHTGTDFDLSAQVLKWDFILLEQNDSCRLTDIARIRFADDDIFVVNIEGVRSTSPGSGSTCPISRTEPFASIVTTGIRYPGTNVIPTLNSSPTPLWMTTAY